MTKITKTKRFFMGAFVGALFTINTNKTNDKQHVNRGYDSESGTTIHKASLQSGAFPFLATVGFWSLQHVIFCWISRHFRRCSLLLDTSIASDEPVPYLAATVFLRSSTVPLSQNIHNEVEKRGKWGISFFMLFNNMLLVITPGGRPGKLLFRQGERTQRHQFPPVNRVSPLYSPPVIFLFFPYDSSHQQNPRFPRI
ncbi:hypothetical protein [Dickeya sp. ws52]|uniref:hypothetical protein n=1 Tax=Dickeya sp. ws52 TaxID=2576377 RepID=UPI00117F5DC4|nr:hypothetical protein [Dickeya sp. ws52]TYL44172.1 hypothetical protein FDP13_01970 [Dickeya sp. ws52]